MATRTKYIAIDLETSGKYPLGDEICEFSLIKFDESGAVLGQLERLVNIRGQMNKSAQKIHGIGHQDLKGQPYFSECVDEFIEFTEGLPLVGHNIQFDLGFLAYELDEFQMDWWEKSFLNVNFCTSLISQGAFPKRTSHRLNYLAQEYQIKEAPNHRATQDALICMKVFLAMKKELRLNLNINSEIDLDAELIKLQKSELKMADFSPEVFTRKNPELSLLFKSCIEEKNFSIEYSKGSKKNRLREVEPKGVVLKSLGGSFLVANDPGESQTKRFMLSKIKSCKSL